MTTRIIRAIFGPIDEYIGNQLPNEVRFTNTNSTFPRKDLNDRLRSKFYKMCQHELEPSAETFLWADGSYELKNGVCEWFSEQLGDNDVVFIQHPRNKTVKEELEDVEKGIASGEPYLTSRYKNENMREQYEHYKKLGFPDTLLVCGGLFLRKNSPSVNQAFDDWFLENVKWTIQDQISLPYIFWKHGLKVKIIDSQCMYGGPFHRYVGHKN